MKYISKTDRHAGKVQREYPDKYLTRNNFFFDLVATLLLMLSTMSDSQKVLRCGLLRSLRHATSLLGSRLKNLVELRQVLIEL